MRVVLADGDVDARSALRLVLDQEPSVEIVGEAEEMRGLLSHIQSAQPDLIILDWDLPGHPVAGLLEALRSGSHDPCVVVVGLRQDDERAALAAGADGFVDKADPPRRFLDALGNWMQNHPTVEGKEAATAAA